MHCGDSQLIGLGSLVDLPDHRGPAGLLLRRLLELASGIGGAGVAGGGV